MYRYLLFTLFTLNVYSQDGAVTEAIIPDPRIELGLKAGINYATMLENRNSFDVESKVGYVGGAFISARVNKIIGGKAEALISQKSFSGSSNIDSTNYIYTRSATYMDLPLLLQVKPTKWLSVVAGLQYTMLLFKNDAVKTNNSEISNEVRNQNNNMSTNNVGACAGLEFTFKRIWVWGRYNVDLDNNNNQGTTTLPSYRNEVVQIGVGYSFFRL